MNSDAYQNIPRDEVNQICDSVLSKQEQQMEVEGEFLLEDQLADVLGETEKVELNVHKLYQTQYSGDYLY